MIERLREKFAFKDDENNTEIMESCRNEKVSDSIQQVNEFNCFGSIITKDGRSQNQYKNDTGLGNKSFLP